MAITQKRIELLLNAAEQINQHFTYNSQQTLHLIARARQQIRGADLETAHATLVTLLHDLSQLHMDYQQQVATPQLTLVVEREHWRLTHKRNAYNRQWLADKRAQIPTKGRNQHIHEHQQRIISQQQSHDLANDPHIDGDFYESSDEFALPRGSDNQTRSD